MIYGAGFYSLILLILGSLIVVIVLHEATNSPEQSFSSRNPFASLIFHNHYAEVTPEMIEAGGINQGLESDRHCQHAPKGGTFLPFQIF